MNLVAVKGKFNKACPQTNQKKNQVVAKKCVGSAGKGVYVKPEIEKAIYKSLNNCVEKTKIGNLKCVQGKVRDTYDLGDKLLIVTTDRQSAFDRVLASIPFKGQVLNQVSEWWFNETRQLVPNALIDVPDPNVSIMKKCKIFPVEFVVRGYMTGSTDTSLWTHYQRGCRMYCGNILPEGMRKNDQLKRNIITPTTKAKDHDVPISPDEIIQQGLMSEMDWLLTSTYALSLFEHGQQIAKNHGLILVDTKYEMGVDDEGTILVVDEVHTPDSSRYWVSKSYRERHDNGQEPENIDKEFLRLWFKEHCDPYADKDLPAAPEELVVELSRRYIYLYETITGNEFKPVFGDVPVSDSIYQNVQKYL